MNTYVGPALLDVYAKCGFIEDAFRVFESTLRKNEVAWSSMIVGFVWNDRYEEGLSLFLSVSCFFLKRYNGSVGEAASRVRKGVDSWSLEIIVGGLVISALLGVKDFEARWIGWAGVNVPDEAGQKVLTEAIAEKENTSQRPKIRNLLKLPKRRSLMLSSKNENRGCCFGGKVDFCSG